MEAESKDPDSIFNAYKKLLALRKTNKALREGTQEDIDEKDPNVYAFLRRSGETTVLVALNMSAKPRTIDLDWTGRGIRASTFERLYASEPTKLDDVQSIELAPFAAVVARLK